MTVLETTAPETPPTIPAPRPGRPSGRDRPADGMCWRRAFPGRPGQARPAREFVAFLAAGFPGADDVVLAAAELTANAIRHTRSGLPGGLFVVELRRWRGHLAVSVTDQGAPQDPAPPAGPSGPDEPSALPESGRGLLTIAALAVGWNWTGGPTGRTVTAVF